MTKTRKVVKKLFTAVVLTAAVAMTAFMAHTDVYAEAVLYGDADCDGEVTANDALAILEYCVGIGGFTDSASEAADVDADNQITANDALSVLKKVVSVIDSFEAAEAQQIPAEQHAQISTQLLHFSVDDIPDEVDREIVITLEDGKTKTVTGHFEKGYADEIVALLNEYREEKGLKALTVNANLTHGAEIRAYEVTAVWEHVRPDGSSWYTVADEAYGENLASGFEDAEATMEGWKKSPGHNANMLKEDYASVGVGVFAMLTETENGTYYTYYCTQLFGY